MKKLLIILLTISSLLTLSACKKEEEIIHEVPSEYAVNLQNLAYSEYLNVKNLKKQYYILRI